VEKLDGSAVSAIQHAIAEAKQRWSVIAWVTKNVLSRAPPCFGGHVKLLVPAAFAVITPTTVLMRVTSGRRQVVKIIAESLSQHDEKPNDPT
jgi:hypothetical protein